MNIEKSKIVKNKSLPRLTNGSTQRYKEVSPNKVTAVEVKCLQSSEYSSDSPRLVPTAWSQIDKIPDCRKQVFRRGGCNCCSRYLFVTQGYNEILSGKYLSA